MLMCLHQRSGRGLMYEDRWSWKTCCLLIISSFFLPRVVRANELTDVFVEVLSAAVNRFNSYN